MEKLKIRAIIKSGHSFSYVLNRSPKFIYTKIDSNTIIGEDERLLNFFEYDNRPSIFGKTAFGGREFTLQLSDGTEEICKGQWWDGMSDTALKLFNIEDITYFLYSTIERLKKLYIYYGCRCDKKWLSRLISEYDGEIYDYFEYERVINKMKK